jgi:hypothetical protein
MGYSSSDPLTPTLTASSPSAPKAQPGFRDLHEYFIQESFDFLGAAHQPLGLGREGVESTGG